MGGLHDTVRDMRGLKSVIIRINRGLFDISY